MLDVVQGKFAYVATYEFDPIFFERCILSRRTFQSAERIVVFMDQGRYRELLERGNFGAQCNSRSLVVPIHRPVGVFHPKLYVPIGDRGALALVGSNNCTAAGTGRNMELVSSFLAKDSNDGISARVVRSAFRCL